MRLELKNAEVLALNSVDQLSVYELDGGNVNGTGEVTVCCEESDSLFAPTVSKICIPAFNAHAVAFDKIDVFLPQSGAVDVRRKIKGTNTWTTVAVSVTGGVYHDQQSASNPMVPGVVYEYQWAVSGNDVWHVSDPAWLTQTHNRKVTAAEYRTSADEVLNEKVQACAVWKITAVDFDLDREGVFMAYQAGAVPVFLARIENSEEGGCLKPAQISSASYSVELVSTEGKYPKPEDTDYHTDRGIPLTAFLETPICDEHWPADNVGYNFKFTPDIREHPAFPVPGEYAITFKAVPVTGNPIVWKRKLRFL